MRERKRISAERGRERPETEREREREREREAKRAAFLHAQQRRKAVGGFLVCVFGRRGTRRILFLSPLHQSRAMLVGI